MNRVHSNWFSHVSVLKDMHGIPYKHTAVHYKGRVTHYKKDLWFLSTKIQAKPLNPMDIFEFVLLFAQITLRDQMRHPFIIKSPLNNKLKTLKQFYLIKT